jgi:hypothetical protein
VEMTRYRREQGMDQGTSDLVKGGPPEIRVRRNGTGTATFWNGCVVSYDRSGGRVENSAECNDGQARRANDAMRKYRREQGLR